MVGNGNDKQEDPMPTTYSQDVVTTLFDAALTALGVTTIALGHTPIASLDSDAFAECEHCADGSLTIMQVYFRSMSTSEDVMATGCAPCMVKLIAADADSAVRVHIETELSS